MFFCANSKSSLGKKKRTRNTANRANKKYLQRRTRHHLLETLENRSLMACDLYHETSQALAKELDFIPGLIKFASAEGSNLPLVGDKLVELGSKVNTFVPKLVDKIDKAAVSAGESGLQQVLYGLFNRDNGELPILGDRTGDGQVNINDVFVHGVFTEAACSVTVGLRLTQELAEVDTPDAKFSLGLDALPFEVSAAGGIKVKFGFDYKNLMFTLSSENGVTIDTSAKDELTLSAEATLDPNSTLDADVGFLHAKVSDGAMIDVNGVPTLKHSKLTAGITFDIAQDQNGFSVTPDFKAQADVDLHIKADVDANFPSVESDLVIHWSGFGDKDPAPTVAFDNISVNLGDVVSQFLSPVVDVIKKTTEPIMPIVDLLTKPIPVLTDLSHELGTGDVSILTLAGLADNKLPEGYKEIVEIAEVVVEVLGIVDKFSTLNGNVIINVGDFDLSSNGDLRKEPKAFSLSNINEKSLTALLMNKSKVADFHKKVEDSDLPEAIKTPLLKVLDRFSSGVNYEFPLFKDPVGSVGKLFLGQDSDLFKLSVNYQIDSSMDITAPIPIGFNVGVKGKYDLDTSIVIGYDTYGLRKFVANGQAAGGYDGDDLLDGLYITKDSHINLDGGIFAQVGVDYLLFEADVSGGLEGGIHISMPTDLAPPAAFPDNDESKIRPFSELDDCLFAADGNLSARLEAHARLGTDLIGVEQKFVLAETKLLDFDVDCVANPFSTPADPNIAIFNPATGVLTLNTVASAGVAQPGLPLRTPHPDEINEHYTLTLDGPKADDPANPPAGDIIVVSAFGVSQRFIGVKKVVANAGSGNDVIKFAKSKNNPGDFTADMDIHGGADNDTILLEGFGTATIFGDDGDDYIVGGHGANYIFGGKGNDTLKGNVSQNWLNGGDDNDTLVGGDGENHLGSFPYKGPTLLEGGNDQLIGGNGLNFMNGGSGNDTLLAGPKSDILDGGAEDDLLVAGAGTATFLGNRGDDHITWKVGDGRPVLIDGGSNIENNTLGLVGSNAAELFGLSKDPGSSRLMISGLTSSAFFADDIQNVDFEGQAGLDQISISTLVGTDARDIAVNLGDVLKNQKGLGDDVADKILVTGNASNDNVTVETEISKIKDPQVGGTSGSDVIYGGIMRVSGLPNYVVHVANVKDDLNVNALAGNDVINVKSITGPTRITDSAGNDTINVFAKKKGNASDPFNLPDYLTGLSVDAGAGTNKLNVDQSGSLIPLSTTVTQTLITSDLLPGVSYVATGGNFNGGVTVATGAFNDKVNIFNTLPQTTTSLNTGAGADTIQVGSSAPNLASNLAGIAGPLNIDAGAGNNTLSMIDRLTTSGNANVVVTANKVLGFAGPSDNSPVTYAASQGQLALNMYGSDDVSEQFTLQNPSASMTIYAGAGNDRVLIPSLSQPTTIFGGVGNDTVSVGSIVNNLDAVTGLIKFAGQQGSDALNVMDSAANSGHAYNVSTVSIQRAGGGLMSFDTTLETVNLATTAFDDSLTVVGTPVVGTMNLFTGAGTDTLQAANAVNQWDVQSLNGGKLNGKIVFNQTERLLGGNQIDTFRMSVGGSITGQISGGGGLSDSLDYSSLLTSQVINVESHTATNVAKWDGIEVLKGSAASDRLVGPNLPSLWKIDGLNSGTLTPIAFPSIQFVGIENLGGGTSTDVFQMGTSGKLTGRLIDQGGVSDRLDYSQWQAPVAVNLTTGSASQIGDGAVNSILGIESVFGGSGDDTLIGNAAANMLKGGAGNDILVGLDGDDTLNGDEGRDVMIGGAGIDTLQGGIGDDLIIGNRTIYDANDVALHAILTEWASPQSYATRVQHLRSPLTNDSVLDDQAKDTMTGNDNADWFWGTFAGLPNLKDLVTDKQALELLN